MKHITILLAFLMTLSTHAVAGETVMVCNKKDYVEKVYYKLVNPLCGSSSVKQRIDSRWVDWCKKPRCVNLEVYDTGAKQERKFSHSWSESYPKEEIVKNQKYYIEVVELIDFEFGKRTVDVQVYMNKSKTKELRLSNVRQDNKEYSCEIQ